MKALQIFKQKLSFPKLLGVTGDAEEKRNGLALAATKVKAITTAGQQGVAVVAARNIRTYVKEVLKAGKALRKPLREVTEQIKAIEDEHLQPLLAEQERLEKLVVTFQQAEQRRVEKEEQARAKEIARLEEERLEALRKAEAGPATGRKANLLAAQAEEAHQATTTAITAPLPEKSRATGVALKKVLRYEVTDIREVYKHRPELCNLEISPAAVKAICVVNMPVPGLRLWEEEVANTRAF